MAKPLDEDLCWRETITREVWVDVVQAVPGVWGENAMWRAMVAHEYVGEPMATRDEAEAFVKNYLKNLK